jgi:polysaccharide biosynthesis transport protein
MALNFSLVTQTLRRGWWIIALATLAALNAALIMFFLATPMYESSASFVISPTDAVVNNGDLIYSIDTLSRRSVVATYTEIFNSRNIIEAAGEEVGTTSDQLAAYSITAVLLPETNVIDLIVKGPDPVLTARLANAVGTHAILFVSDLTRIYDIKVLDPAIPPSSPYSPKPSRDIGFAAAIGLLVGIALAIVYVQLRFMLFTNPENI